MVSSVEICLCHAPEDDKLRRELEKQLKPLQRYLLFDLWHSYDIRAGAEIKHEMRNHLNAADIIILLLSPDFLASEDLYNQIVVPAMKRHKDGDARVIPVILRPVHWQEAPLGKLQALPRDGKPITLWENLDEALFNVTEDIRKAVKDIVDMKKPTLNVSANEITESQPFAETEETIPPLFRRDHGDVVLLHTFVHHWGPVTCVTFASDGKTLVSDSIDGTIIFRNLPYLQEKIFARRLSPIYSITLSNDMQTLISAGQDSTIKIWDLQSGQVRETLRGHSDAVSSVALSPDGNVFVSGSYDKTVSLWNASTGTRLRTLVEHSGPVSAVAVSSDMITLASGCLDSTIKIWDIQTGQRRRTLVGHSGPVFSVAFSPDGSILVSGSYDKTITIWDCSTGQVLKNWKAHSEPVLCVAFHPFENLIASGSLDTTVKVWQWQKKTTIPFTSYPPYKDTPQPFQPNSRIPSRRVILNSLATLGIVSGSIAVGYLLLTKAIPLVPRQINTTTPTPSDKAILTYRGHTNEVNTVAWSQQGEYVASGSGDNTVQVWNAVTGDNLYTYRGHTSFVHSVTWAPSGKRIASGSLDKTVQVWDTLTGNHTFVYNGHIDYVDAVAWSPDGTRIASGADSVQVWNATSGTRISTFSNQRSHVFSLAWSPDGTRIVCAVAYDGQLYVLDASNGRLLLTIKGVGMGVAWSPDGQLIASVVNKTVQLWNASTGDLVDTYSGHTGNVDTAVWSPNGKFIASGGAAYGDGGGMVRVWSPSTHTTIFTYQAHDSYVQSITWSPDSTRIAAACRDHVVRIWKVL